MDAAASIEQTKQLKEIGSDGNTTHMLRQRIRSDVVTAKKSERCGSFTPDATTAFALTWAVCVKMLQKGEKRCVRETEGKGVHVLD